MLRPKNLGTLSQSARFFILNGSRCSSPGDESSCTCSEDDTCSSRRPALRPNRQQSSSLFIKTPAGVASLITADTVHQVNAKKADSGSVSLTQPITTAHSRLLEAAKKCTDDLDPKNMLQYLPPPTADFIKAGMSVVNIFSDMVGTPIKIEETAPVLCMTRTKTIPAVVASANVKTYRNEKNYGKQSSRPVPESNLSNVPADKKGKPCSDRGVTDISSYEISSEQTFEQKRSVPQRPRSYSNRFSSNTQQSEGKFNGFTKPINAPAARQSGNSVVERVSRILQQNNWCPSTEDVLCNLNCLLDAYQANQVLKQLQDYTVALGFFYWLKRQPGFKHDGHTYTTMVGILGRARQFGAIDKLLDQMVNDGCQPNVVTYNRLIHSYGRANHLSEALRVFDEMQKLGCKPDRVTYCTLIDIHAKSGYLDIAIDMYERMQKAGLSPDTFTYSVMINCLGKAGHLAVAHKLFCEMVNQGCVPNLVTYNIMIALHAKARNYQSALQLYRDMQSAGFEPDKVSYSIVMEVLGHCGYMDEAEAIFSEMKRKNWVPDEPVYGLLVDLWGKAGNVEKAWQWYREMLNAGLCPNVPTCNSLLSAFLRVHRLPDAYNLLQSMMGLGLIPSLQTYTLLLSCCTEAQTPYDMGFCCELMTVSNHPAHAFLTSMPTPGPDGQNVRNHVSGFLDMMHSEDRESKRGLVDAVIDFFHKTGLKEEAGSVWEVAAQKNVYPEAVREKTSCYWLINLHVMSDGTAVTALSRTLASFRREMLISGICPSRIDIVTGWGRRSRVTGASLVRQAVQELLNVFRFPFFTENGNSGCFVGCGESLNRWLLESYVDRMHLM